MIKFSISTDDKVGGDLVEGRKNMKETSAMTAMKLQWDEEREAALVREEEVIRNGKGAFERVAKALTVIKEEGLYLKTHGSFKAYCEEKWGFTRQWAYRLMDAVAVKGNLLSEGKKVDGVGVNRLAKMKRVTEVEAEVVKVEKPVMEFSSDMAGSPVLAAMAIEWSLIQATMAYVEITPRVVYEKMRKVVKEKMEVK